MIEDYKIKAWPICNKLTGGDLNKMRKEGFIPGVIYGGNTDNFLISVITRNVEDYIEKNPVRNRVFIIQHLDKSSPKNIKVSNNDVINISEERCYLRSIQYHPVTDKPLHIELQRLNNESEKPIAIEVPIKEKNYFTSLGIRHGGKLNRVRRKLRLYCPHDRIVPTIEVDLEKCDIGHIIRVRDLNLPDYVRVLCNQDEVIFRLSGRSSANTKTTTTPSS
ncbi:50S ribosomal protein L25 [Lyticum sinuosum]|uniref:50S ribosomal protein L25 n=1 Tax=Lyticum sinuosum TaxID=1332059 RepID=A0AAE5AGP2_9RICK|nr:50S ribosomal protein L25 [Lyticum sinuosum]MDZ5761027.1 50S ribosomal protein L25 [Lyticum sinuosum]